MLVVFTWAADEELRLPARAEGIELSPDMARKIVHLMSSVKGYDVDGIPAQAGDEYREVLVTGKDKAQANEQDCTFGAGIVMASTHFPYCSEGLSAHDVRRIIALSHDE